MNGFGSMLGMRVVINDNLPGEHIGDEIKELVAHPHIRWLLRLLGVSEHVMWLPGKAIRSEPQPLFLAKHRTIICTSRHYEALKKVLA